MVLAGVWVEYPFVFCFRFEELHGWIGLHYGYGYGLIKLKTMALQTYFIEAELVYYDITH